VAFDAVLFWIVFYYSPQSVRQTAKIK